MEKLLWSIVLPGFGQLLNGKYLKGLLFITLEFLVNVQAHFNKAILSSFHGNIQKAIGQADYQWLMFYPCLYCFAAWDAYRDDRGKTNPYFFTFCVCCIFCYCRTNLFTKFKNHVVLLGPVWLPILSFIPGVGVGLILIGFGVLKC